jgi:hypothetical protein
MLLLVLLKADVVSSVVQLAVLKMLLLLVLLKADVVSSVVQLAVLKMLLPLVGGVWAVYLAVLKPKGQVWAVLNRDRRK